MKCNYPNWHLFGSSLKKKIPQLYCTQQKPRGVLTLAFNQKLKRKEESILSSTINYDTGCGVFIDAVYQIEEVSYCFSLLSVFIMKGCRGWVLREIWNKWKKNEDAKTGSKWQITMINLFGKEGLSFSPFFSLFPIPFMLFNCLPINLYTHLEDL